MPILSSTTQANNETAVKDGGLALTFAILSFAL